MAYVIPKKVTARVSFLPITVPLKDGGEAIVDYIQDEDHEATRAMLNEAIREGNSYPYEDEMDADQFRAYFLSGEAFVAKHASTKQVIGSFYIKPNFPGRCSHICNGGFLVEKNHRGNGLGKQMALLYLRIAPALGYRASFFNLVFSTNPQSLGLWRSLQFKETGIVPHAARLNSGEYVNCHQFYKEFEN